MLIIPAIDIRDGNCVMLKQGRVEDETIYSKDPVFMAKIWQAKGAPRLHVVDLDGALQGTPKNMSVLKDIRANTQIPIQFGGGIRSFKAVEAVFELGIDYCILGTVALYNPEILRQALEKYGKKIIVAVDIRDSKVAIGGWKETTTTDPIELAKKLKDMGVEEILSTDIQKDGMMDGPNFESLKGIAKASKLKVIASGGVSSIEDIKTLIKIEPFGVHGAIIGKALYNDSIKLEEALKLACFQVKPAS